MQLLNGILRSKESKFTEFRGFAGHFHIWDNVDAQFWAHLKLEKFELFADLSCDWDYVLWITH